MYNPVYKTHVGDMAPDFTLPSTSGKEKDAIRQAIQAVHLDSARRQSTFNSQSNHDYRLRRTLRCHPGSDLGLPA